MGITADHILYAKWLITYSVSFDAQGGDDNPENKTVSEGTASWTLPTLSNIYNSFMGWWTSPGGKGSEVAASTIVSVSADQPLYAYWVVKYQIGFAGPAGGMIFYDDLSDGIDNIPGSRFLEVSPSGWVEAGSTSDFVKPWGGRGISILTGLGIGTGEANTISIVNSLGAGGDAAYVCYNLVLEDMTIGSCHHSKS